MSDSSLAALSSTSLRPWLSPRAGLWRFSWGAVAHVPTLLTPGRSQSTDTTKFYLVNQWVLLVLQECGRVVTYRRNDSKTAAPQSSPQHEWQLTKRGTCSLQADHRLESVPSNWLSWSKSLPDNTAGFCFPGSCPSFRISFVACLRKTLNFYYCFFFFTPAERALVNLDSFRNFLKLLWVISLLL